jgi:hypothetical protein
VTRQNLEKTAKEALSWFHDEYHDGDGPITKGPTRIDNLCLKAFESSVDGKENVSICLSYGGHVILDALARRGIRIHEVNDDPDCEKPGHIMKAYLGWFDEFTYACDSEEFNENGGDAR